MTDKFSAPFPITTQKERPVWRAKAVAVPVYPMGATGYYERPNDFVEYDGFTRVDANGDYHVAFIGESFFASVHPTDFEQGRSAANVRLTDHFRAEKSYLIGAYEYVLAVQGSPLTNGGIRGEWVFRKKGANYRIELLRHVA